MKLLSIDSAIRLFFAVALVCVLGVIADNIGTFVYDAGGAPGFSDNGAYFVVRAENHRAIAVASDVEPGKPFALAGVREGDHVRFDRPSDAIRVRHAGERIGLTVLGDPLRHLVIIMTPPPPDEHRQVSWYRALDALSALLGSGTGLFILLRSRRSPSLIALGVLFACLNYEGATPLQNAVATYPAWCVVRVLLGIALSCLFPLFSILYFREQVGRVARWAYWAFAAWLALITAFVVDIYLLNLSGTALVDGVDDGLVTVLADGTNLIAIGGLIYGWLKSRRESQRRYAMVLVALGCFLLYSFSSTAAKMLGLSLFRSWLVVPFEVFGTAAPLIFAYAVLKDKVLDLGFAVNRTLVYGMVSLVLLLAFGLAEWGVDQVLPETWLKANQVISAVIALVIFLTFHRVRDFIEKVVESLFFSAWHHNEEKLRRFVKQAAFIGRADKLTAAFLAELKRFSGGMEAVLYLAAGDDFTAGDTRIDGDDQAVIAMKADHAPVEVADHLDLPMIHRGELTGFVRLGLKPSGESYRPDEREVLAWAAHQVGLDLYALKVEALEARVATLDAQLAFAAGLAKGSGRAQARRPKDKAGEATA